MENQVLLTRAALEKCVREYKREKASYFLLPGDLKGKQIPNALRKFAPGVEPEEVVALMDTTLMNSGKDGYLLTTTHMYGKSFEGRTIDLNRISKINREDGYVIATYPDGRKDRLYAIIFDQDLFNILKLILREREELNRVKATVYEKVKSAAEPEFAKEKKEAPVPKPVPGESPEDLFARGTAAFMAKDYPAAMTAFQKAADMGHQKAAMFLDQLKGMMAD